MKPSRRNSASGATQKAILDATEKIMREEGYAAVSSRRVEERAGFKSKLVHYHFKSMDELFLAVFQRANEQFQTLQAEALASDNPVEALWKLWIGSADTELVAEFIALATHRKAVRKEIRRANDSVRKTQTAAIARTLAAAGVDEAEFPPEVMAFLMAAVARTLVTEKALGSSAAHPASVGFIERQLERLEKRIANASLVRDNNDDYSEKL